MISNHFVLSQVDSTEQGRMEKSNQTISATECCPTPNNGKPRTLNQIVSLKRNIKIKKFSKLVATVCWCN